MIMTQGFLSKVKEGISSKNQVEWRGVQVVHSRRGGNPTSRNQIT